ncbi:MAG: hypothetical protein IPJ87_10985 [Flavobacteriales bacterium]|nr:hypothetical protein [Flavobacteriales bacterium]MBK7942378.1 hypothetical protein [Flavobacteriales bacterium]MBK9699220.1 hypothetical protein [Flavobacteriales bacterium]
MRALLLLSLFCSGALLRAQGTVSSVTAGAWTSAGTWDCACVPQTGDTIVVQHSVGLPSNVVHLGGAIRITATGALVGSGPSGLWSNAPFTNAGQVSVHRLVLPEGNAWTDSLLNSGTIATTRMAVRRRGRNTGVITAIDSLVFDHCSFHNEATISSRVTWVRDSLLWNNGLFISYELIVDSTGLFHNVGTCRVLDHLAVRSSGNFNVATGAVETHVLGDADIRWGLNVWDAHLQVDGRLHLNDVEVPIPHLTFFVQGGSIHTGHFRNQGWVAGPGTLCIADSAENLGILHPDLTICDATPTSFTWPYLDLNTGTVDPAVLVCPTGSCTVGGTDRHGPRVIRLVRGDGRWTVTGLPEGHVEVELIDAGGRRMPCTLIGAGPTLELRVPAITEGAYALLLTTAQGTRALRFVQGP